MAPGFTFGSQSLQSPSAIDHPSLSESAFTSVTLHPDVVVVPDESASASPNDPKPPELPPDDEEPLPLELDETPASAPLPLLEAGPKPVLIVLLLLQPLAIDAAPSAKPHSAPNRPNRFIRDSLRETRLRHKPRISVRLAESDGALAPFRSRANLRPHKNPTGPSSTARALSPGIGAPL
jgi:hypothetical protein